MGSVANPNTSTMYLRGVPRELVREAKAAAAKRGTTLTGLVAEALDRFLSIARTEMPEVLEPIADDLAWYEANKAKLLRRYRNEFIAIVNRKVVDHDQEFDALARRVFARYGTRPICMPRVVPGEEVVNLRSPRIVR
ncbi:MAG: hypothetical protein HYT96_02305 [Armatimonadetes bacterium]|nr:hypothetical protein [Armatimonadota bacterium]MBI2201098.1 hypothetical protein [Armatimonadota bacterium]